MSFLSELQEITPHIVTVKKKTGTADAYSRLNFDSGTAYDALVVDTPRMVRMADGNEKVTRTTVYILGNSGIDVNDKLVLPSGDDTRPIMSVERQADETGAQFEIVGLG